MIPLGLIMTNRIRVTIAELNIFLHDAMRDTPHFPILDLVAIRPSGTDPSGWTVDFDHTVPEDDRRTILGAVHHLQRRYILEMR